MRTDYKDMDKDLKDYLVKGKYGFEIDEVNSEYVSATKKTPALEVKCHVFDGPDQDDEGTSPIGMSAKFYFWLSDNTVCKKRVNDFLDVLGFHDARKAGEEIPDSDFVGKRFVATSTPKTDEYGTKNELSFVEAYQG